jgi:Arc/MetJ-type ribon-helix-helix transcriptional regulator
MAGKHLVPVRVPARAGPLRDRSPDSEKITINLGLVDLGQIDLLVVEGFYSNRTDFIRTAIRNQLAVHAEPIRQTIARKTLVVGLRDITKQELEQAVPRKTAATRVLGLIRIATTFLPGLRAPQSSRWKSSVP